MYLTSAMDNESFKEYLRNWTVSPNLSNQNFHNKLIRAIATTNDVDVICYRSINIHFKKIELPAQVVKENNIHWKYLYCSISKIAKKLYLWSRVKRVTLFDQKAVIVDALNLSLLRIALKIRKKYGMKVLAVCTDNPNNISYATKLYRKKLLKLGRKCDAFVTLTPKLNELYNPNGKPNVTIDGICEPFLGFAERKVQGDYIYFGGSLMRRYGVYNLIEAFKNLDKDDLKLVLCGHHVDKDELKKAIGNDNRILYFGSVDYYNNLSLEKYSLVAVNPRPKDEKLDEYSVPSKTLEFLSNGCLSISVDNPTLKAKYEDCIIWAKSGSSKDLEEALRKALSLSEEEKTSIIERGLTKVNDNTSVARVGSLIDYLLAEFFFN